MSSTIEITEVGRKPKLERKPRPLYLQGITEAAVDDLWDAVNTGTIDQDQTRLLARLGAPIRDGGNDSGELLYVEVFADGRKHFIYQVPARRREWENDDGWRVIHIDSKRVILRALLVTNRHFSNRNGGTEGRAAA